MVSQPSYALVFGNRPHWEWKHLAAPAWPTSRSPGLASRRTPLSALPGTARPPVYPPSGRATGLLVCVDGLASDVTAFTRAFRVPVRTGRVGRPRLVLPDSFLLGQVVAQYAKRHVAGVVHRIICGTPAAVTAALAATHGGTILNTAYIERRNATFRRHFAPLTRRGRALARSQTVLTGQLQPQLSVPALWRPLG